MIAIIAIGIAVVAGGTAITITLKNKTDQTQSITEVESDSPVVSIHEEALSEATASSKGAISNQVKTSAKAEVNPSLEAPRVNQREPSKSVALDERTQGICREIAKQEIDTSSRSITEDIRVLCKNLQVGKYEGERLDKALTLLQEKYQLWLQATANVRQREFEKHDSGPVVDTPEDIAERERVRKLLETHDAEISSQTKESYKESSTYPIILSFEDNLGNIYKQSTYNGYSGPYSGWTDESNRIIHVGDTIRATVLAKDPQDRALEYNWDSNSKPFMDSVSIENGRYKYTSYNKLSYTITEEDLKSVGETFRLVWQVRVAGSDVYRFGQGGYDDTGFIDYKIAR